MDEELTEGDRKLEPMDQEPAEDPLQPYDGDVRKDGEESAR